MEDAWADETLRQRLLERDPRALEALIGRYAREAAYFVRMVLDSIGTPQDAEECVNDLFVTAWEDIAEFDPARGALRTWLTMRAKYLALDRRRQIQRRHALLGPPLTGGRGRAGESVGLQVMGAGTMDCWDSMDGLLERHERQEELRRALERLPELDRLLVYMRYFRLASAEEIAARTGLTRRAIDTRLWRARKTLREALEVVEERSHGQVRAL